MAQSKSNQTKAGQAVQGSVLHGPHEAAMLAFRRESSFSETMAAVQEDMSPHARTFSRFIHLAPIEITSDIVSRTVGRPTALLCGGIFAFFGLFALYLMAREIGFSLRGSELYLLFVVGWLVGTVIDLFRIIFGATRTDA